MNFYAVDKQEVIKRSGTIRTDGAIAAIRMMPGLRAMPSRLFFFFFTASCPDLAIASRLAFGGIFLIANDGHAILPARLET